MKKPFPIQIPLKFCLKTLAVRFPALPCAVLLLILLRGFADAGDKSLPFFPEAHITNKNNPFEDILRDYHNKNYSLALEKALLLKKERPRGPILETVLFLIGDLHLKLAEKRGARHLRKALSAFRTARATYPDSENTVRSLWRLGQAYARLDLYYESLANFNRLLIKHPGSPFVPWAQFGIAETYQRWGKTKKTLESYEKINLAALSPREVGEIFTRKADFFYHMGWYEDAYQTYQKIPWRKKAPQMSPQVLFQYGESAYQNLKTTHSRKLFMAYFSLHPKTDLAPIALSRVGDTWRLEGKTTLSRSISKQIRSLPSKPSGRELRDLLVAVSDLKFIQDGKGNKIAAGRLALKAIKENGKRLLDDPDLPHAFQRVLLEAAEISARHGALVNALEIEEALISRTSSDYMQKEVQSAFQVTVDKMIARLSKEKDAMRVIDTYHRHPNIFKTKSSSDAAILKVAISHKHVGLFSQAITLLKPLAGNKDTPLREQILFHLADAYFQNGNPQKSEKIARDFIMRFPGSTHLPHVQKISARVKDQQGKLDKAIREYLSWLKHYPKHRDQDEISLFLADAYQQKGNLKLAVEVYIKVDSRFTRSKASKAQHKGLHLKLADAYFKLGNYKKSTVYYNLVLKESAKGEKAEWAKFQLAMNYDKIGKKDKGIKIFNQLSKKAKDPLLKALSEQKIRTDDH